MPSKQVTTLSFETIDRYRQWCIGRGRSANTVRAYTSDLKEFLKAAGENEQVTREEYEELAMSWLNLTRNTWSPKTTARRLTSLRSFAKWADWPAVLEDYIAPTPGKTIPHPIHEGIEGIRKMIEVAKNHEQVALVTLGGFVGCRISESLSLTIKSIDVHEMLVTIRGKGDKTRTVPLSEEAWTYIVPSFALALAKDDQRLVSYKDRFARQIITNLGLRAGLSRKIASHDLRATFATAALDKTSNIRVVQELLGHASSQTTEVYTGVAVSQMREAVQF
jgi:site-specific recombinase XerD